MNSKLTTSQSYTLSNVLSDWDDNQSFTNILKRIKSGSNKVTVWDTLSDIPEDDLCELITDLEKDFRAYTARVTQDLFEAIAKGDPQDIVGCMFSLQSQLRG